MTAKTRRGRAGREDGMGRGAPEPARGGTKDVAASPRPVDLDPWAVLLERLREEPVAEDAVAADDAAAGKGGAGQGRRRRRRP